MLTFESLRPLQFLLEIVDSLCGLQKLHLHQNIYFIFTDCLPAPSSAKAAALNLGGPKVILGLREKPKPSLGMASDVSSLPLAFSSWISDKA